MAKFGLLWDNYEGIVPRMPFQPEFVVLVFEKNENETSSYEYAEIHSDNNFYSVDGVNQSAVQRMKNRFQCNDNTEFIFSTINDAYSTCEKINSTVKTYYSKVCLELFDTAAGIVAADVLQPLRYCSC